MHKVDPTSLNKVSTKHTFDTSLIAEAAKMAKPAAKEVLVYVIQRRVGKTTDYLHEWCDQWGTACMGSVKLAMAFATFDEATAAAKRAQRECKGADGKPAAGVTFTVANSTRRS